MALSSRGGGGGGGEEQQQRPYKKRRVVWTTELHKKFVKACRSLGRDAVPKKILERMNAPDLTRENVASHLQKYRIKRKKKAIRRRCNKARVPMMDHAAQPLQAAAPPALHPPPQAPFATPSVSQPQIGVGHEQLIHPTASSSGNNVANLLHQHPNFPIVQPVQHYSFAPVQDAAILQRTLTIELQAAWMQEADAASGYNHTLLRDYSQTVTSAPAAPCRAQSHRPEPQMQASRAVNISGECLVPEANVIDEQMEARMAQLQIAVNPEEGQERCAGPEPDVAASVGPDSSTLDQFWTMNNSEPSCDYGFPPNKPT